MRVLVTGTSTGLGLGFATAYAERGDEVLAACRISTPELLALDVEVLDGIDLAQDDAPAKLRDGVGGRSIDVLVCNAGVNLTFAASVDELDATAMRPEFEVNTLGVVRTVQGVLPTLGEGAKIALISTWFPGMDGPHPKAYGYQMSKMAMNQFGFLIARDLAPRGISVVMLSPGPIDTAILWVPVKAENVTLPPGLVQDPLDVAREFLARIDELTLDTSGTWLFRTGEDMGALATSRPRRLVSD